MEPMESIHGILPKNICLNLENCMNPELCQTEGRIHPKWAITFNACIHHFQDKCKFSNKECKRTHITWKKIFKKIDATNSDQLSQDYFTRKYSSFYNS